jgi:hypothetical protein
MAAGLFGCIVDPSVNSNVGATNVSFCGSMERIASVLDSLWDCTVTEPLYVEITSLTKGSECILFTIAEFKVIFGGVGLPPPMPGPPPPCACWELDMKSMFGARLLNCLLNDSVKDAPMPLTATKRALPDITIKIVNVVLSFLSLKDSNEKMKVSLIFTIFLSSMSVALRSGENHYREKVPYL